MAGPGGTGPAPPAGGGPEPPGPVGQGRAGPLRFARGTRAERLRAPGPRSPLRSRPLRPDFAVRAQPRRLCDLAGKWRASNELQPWKSAFIVLGVF